MTNAAPRPITARKPISSAGVPENAASTEPMPNTASPPTSTFLRPSRSPRSPAVNSRPAKTRV